MNSTIDQRGQQRDAELEDHRARRHICIARTLQTAYQSSYCAIAGVRQALRERRQRDAPVFLATAAASGSA